MAGYNPKRLRLKSRQAPLTFMRAWYSALPAELRAAQRYTPPSRIWGLVTLTCETVEPSESVYWLARCAESRATGSSSSVQVMVGGGAPLAAHMREKGSPGATTRSLKDETIRGVPSDRKKREEYRKKTSESLKGALMKCLFHKKSSKFVSVTNFVLPLNCMNDNVS